MSASNYTAQESKTKNVLAMGKELGESYSAVWQDLAGAYRKWEIYVELFGTKESRIILMNQAAPDCFGVIQDTLFKDVVLNIARLTDPPQSMKKNNLSIQLIAQQINGPAKTLVQESVLQALDAATFFRDWRNRHIAHRDLVRALSPEDNPLKPASREKIRQALDAIAAVLNVVASHYLDSTTRFSSGAYCTDAHSLLQVLHDGIEIRNAKKIRRKSGVYHPEDFKPQDL